MNNTTSLIIEILVSGYTALIWIILLILTILNKDILWLKDKVFVFKSFIPIALLFITAIAYQVGWLIDYISYKYYYYGWKSFFYKYKKVNDAMTGIARKWKREDASIPDGNFLEMYNYVSQKSSKKIQDDLNIDLGIVRVTRCAIINFKIMGITLILYNILLKRRNEINFKVILYQIIILIIILFMIWLFRGLMEMKWKHWFEKIKKSYDLSTINE